MFLGAFNAPTFAKVSVLILGAILTPGRRRVTAALRMMGPGNNKHFGNFYRALNRDSWPPWVGNILLGLIILFLPAGMPLILAIDEALERRRGQPIKYKDWFRDAILSTKAYVVTALSIRWIGLAVAPGSWSQ